MHNQPMTRSDAITLSSLQNKYSVEELIGQFLLSKKETIIAWKVDSIGGWNLSVHESLPCSHVYIGSRIAGWLLGRAIGPDGTIVAGNLRVHSEVDIEAAIYSHGGRYLVILPELQRIYLDPCGLLSAVYCEHAQLVASSTSLIPYDDLSTDRIDLLQSIGIPHVNGTLPLGMTSRHAVQRIIPNHYLDLSTWQIRRHWPDCALPALEDISGAIEEIASIIKRQMQAILRQGPATLRLTAGRDSRVLLACACDLEGDLDSITFDLGDYISKHDSQIARKLARIAGIPHHFTHWVEPEQRDLELWLFRTGFGTAELRGWRGTTAIRTQFDASRSDIVGVIGEVARGYFWLPEDVPDTEIGSERLLSHINCPKTTEIISHIEEWVSGCTASDALQLLDLFFLEGRHGPWVGGWANADAAYSRFQAFPYCHRRVIELMIRLPTEFRRNGVLSGEIISRRCPELLKYPFNKLPISGRLWDKIKREARDPKQTARKLHQRLIR